MFVHQISVLLLLLLNHVEVWVCENSTEDVFFFFFLCSLSNSSVLVKFRARLDLKMTLP